MERKTTYRIAVFFTTIGLFLNANAQNYETELLRDYKLPEIKRHTLDFNFNSAGSFYNNSSKTKDQEKSETKHSSIAGNIAGTYTFYKNTHNFIGKQLLSVRFAGNYSKLDYSYGELFNKERGYINPEFFYSNSSRFYFSNLFIETGGSLQLKYNRSYGDLYSYNTQDEIRIPLFIGAGRIQNVEDMRQALYIINKLSQKGVINQHSSYNNIYELAELISTVKNKRFFDSRKKMISEISSIDSFLVKNNIIQNNGAEYFTTLYDYWLYGALFERKSGTEWKMGFNPSYRFHQDKDDSYFFKTRNNYLNLLGNLSFTYEKPANLYWQHSIAAEINAGVQKTWKRNYYRSDADYDDETLYSKYKDDYKSIVTNFHVSYYAGYYPNSRTNLNIGISESFYNQNNREKEMKDLTTAISSTNLHFDTYYYLSPQLRIAANSSLGYVHNFMKNPNYDPIFKNRTNVWQGDFSISLTYSLF